MYRAVSLYALNHGLIDAEGEIDVPALVQKLPQLKLRFVPNADLGISEMHLNGEIV